METEEETPNCTLGVWEGFLKEIRFDYILED